jgi:hypothetical protein
VVKFQVKKLLDEPLFPPVACCAGVFDIIVAVVGMVPLTLLCWRLCYHCAGTVPIVAMVLLPLLPGVITLDSRRLVPLK